MVHNEDPRNTLLLVERILAHAEKKGFAVYRIGTVGMDDILLLESGGKINSPNLLVAAGFHGEEPAGPWAVLSFLEQLDSTVIEDVNLAILPLINPTGIRAGRRHNDWGENPNCGFCHPELDRDPVSREGQILLDNLGLLVEKAKDGFISLHEDVDENGFYLYTFETSNVPGTFSCVLRDTGSHYFELLPDKNDPEIGNIQKGTIFNHCDGSFEDRLFHEGVPRTACTETPGRRELSKRIEANVAIVNEFIKYR